MYAASLNLNVIEETSGPDYMPGLVICGTRARSFLNLTKTFVYPIRFRKNRGRREKNPLSILGDER